jgi:putative flippase GtrA
MKSAKKSGGGLALRYSLTAGLGFLTDAGVLKGGMALGLDAAMARCVSLFCAMQVTFWVNGLLVFNCIEPRRLHWQWLRYMGGNGFGNICNYLIFVTLISLHQPIISNQWVDLTLGAAAAWLINFTWTRRVVFTRRAEVSAATRS